MQRYDRAITVFSPDGRLLQVEYAREAVTKGSISVGFRSNSFVILGGEKRSMGKLQSGHGEKIFQVDDHMMAAFAGLGADANVLADDLKVECAQAKYSTDAPISVLQLTRAISSLKENCTLTRGRRPYGVSTLIAGWNMEQEAPGLYQIDPNGAYLPYVATAIGRNEQLAKEYFESKIGDWQARTEEEGVRSVLQALQESFAMRMSKDNVEVAIVDVNGFRRLAEEELQGYLDELAREAQVAGQD